MLIVRKQKRRTVPGMRHDSTSPNTRWESARGWSRQSEARVREHTNDNSTRCPADFIPNEVSLIHYYSPTFNYYPQPRGGNVGLIVCSVCLCVGLCLQNIANSITDFCEIFLEGCGVTQLGRIDRCRWQSGFFQFLMMMMMMIPEHFPVGIIGPILHHYQIAYDTKWHVAVSLYVSKLSTESNENYRKYLQRGMTIKIS